MSSETCLGDGERPSNGNGVTRTNSMGLDVTGEEALVTTTVSNTNLISGSLSHGIQNALATGSEFFFGVDELNLFGMDGMDSNNNNFLSASKQ